MDAWIMAEWKYTVSTEHNNYPHLTVYDRKADGELCGWRVKPNDGYVMYDVTDEATECDEFGNERPVTYYYKDVLLPLGVNWDAFPWRAVPHNGIDKDYIL